MRPGGLLALSGILAEQADDLIACYAPYVPLSIADTPRRLGLPVRHKDILTKRRIMKSRAARCQTVFPRHTGAAEARAGKVRCGQCQGVQHAR